MIARAAQLNTSSSQWPTYHWSCSYTEYKYLQPFPPAPFVSSLLSQNNSRVRPSSSILLQRAPPSPFSACIGTTSRSTGFIALSALLTPL